MNRRQFIAGAAISSSGLLAGCLESIDDTPPQSFETSEYPPYPDVETIDFSGDGSGSEEFEVTHDGPVIVDVAHAGSGDFTVRILDSEQLDETDSTEEREHESSDTENSSNESAEAGDEIGFEGEEIENWDAIEGVVAEVTGPFEGQSIHSLDTGSYTFDVIDASDEWEATLHFVPVYDDGSGVGVELPVTNTGVFHSVVGPIDFGELHKTSFSFESNDGMVQRVYLRDREGEIVYVLFDVDGDVEETVSVDVSGIGYVNVETTGSWELTIEEHVGESASDQTDDEDAEEDMEDDSDETDDEHEDHEEEDADDADEEEETDDTD